jgi:transcriptional regulator with XRE-family HTH domain
MAKLLLDKVLKKKKISKRQFAKRLGIDYASVFRFFRPGYDPKLSTLEKWAVALDVRIKDLFSEDSK